MVEVPLEKVVIDSCSQKFVSVLSDLSGLSLRCETPTGESGEGGEGGKKAGGKYRTPGVMKDGRLFLTELFKFAKFLMSTGDHGVVQLLPFTSEKVGSVCTIRNDVCTLLRYHMYKLKCR